MYRRAVAIVVAALIAAAAIGCARRPAEPPPSPVPVPEPPPGPATPQPPATVEEWLKHLTLDEKVGQMLWVGLEGPEVNPRMESLLKAGKVGGIILFARNGTEPNAGRQLTARLQELATGRERFAPSLAVMADQEGGLVQRYRHPFTEWPGNMALGATGNPDYANRMAAATARELRAVGINMNLAPVADVNNNPANPVIGIRSFGEDVRLVSEMAAAAVRGYQEQGVLATAKHFPGHGDTSVDSHYALPVINHQLPRLEQVELPPFQAAISAKVSAIMTAHVVFPALVPNGKPATLAGEVLTGLLRERLGYQGVIVTDAMEMKAIADDPGVDQGLIQAVQAGADALLLAESFAEQEQYHATVVQAVNDGTIAAARIDDAVRRILVLKAAGGLLPGVGQPLQQPALDTIGAAEHRHLAQQIADDAVTLVRNDAGTVPLSLNAGDRVLVVGVNSPPALAEGRPGAATWLGWSVRQQHENTGEVAISRQGPTDQEIAAVRQELGNAEVVVYGVYNADAAHQALINEILAAGKRLVLVGLGEPYDLLRLPQVRTYVAAYGYSSTNLQAVGPLIFGKRAFAGKLPVSIPGLYETGHGLGGAR